MEKVRVRRKVRTRRPTISREVWALVIFVLVTLAAPLAFGAVDRIVQIPLLVLLGVGIWISPPSIARPGRLGNALIVVAIVLLLLKEFAPAAIFGQTTWRTTLTESYGVVFPWTHNPEPSRALDGLLAGIVAIVWFQWVRTLAVDRGRRTVMIWAMLSSAALVAAVSFLTRGIDPDAIYGLRYTPGWVGFGPFPNRNHTACLLAMGILLGAGCVGWAGVRKNYKLMLVAIALSATALAGLLATLSRGGVVVLAAGFVAFLALVLLRFPSIRALSIAAGAMLMLLAVGAAFGAQVLARFASKESGEVSTLMRVQIWRDAVQVWKDAPLFGHGIGSFTQIFPMYQRVATGEAVVLHPESSWLQWLVELGAVPVLFATILAVAYVLPRLRVAYSANRSIFMRAGPFAAAAVLIVHSFFDVPAHRWGTVGFGLAALAIACAPSSLSGLYPAARRAALVPVGVAVFWTLPFVVDWPAWSPLSLTRLLAREQTTPFVSVTELQQSLKYFPLNPTLHYSIAMHQIDDPHGRRTAEWQRHFRIASRLMPNSWELAAMQARAAGRRFPGIALHYWQLAVERAGHRSGEVLGFAIQETNRFPGAAAAWDQYTRLNPQMLLTYARHISEEPSRDAFSRWWKDRATVQDRLEDEEIDAFYSLATIRGTPEQFEQFCRRHSELRARDFRTWVAILDKWGEHAVAWDIIAAEWPELPARNVNASGDLGRLQKVWETDPLDVVNAQDYAERLAAMGDTDSADAVVMKVASRSQPRPPEWFVRKAAHLRAAKGDRAAAVALFVQYQQTGGARR